MAYIIENLNLAVGLQWKLHPSIAQARAAVKGAKKTMFVRKMMGADCMQGIYEGPKKRGLLAGAMMVAEAEPASDVLVLHEIGDGQAWVCAIRGGIPLQDYEEVVPLNKAHSLLAEAMGYLPKADIYGSATGARGTLEELLSRVDKRLKVKCQLQAPINPLVPIGLGIGLFSLAGATAYGIHQHFKQAEMEKEGLRLSLLEMQRKEEVERAKVERQRAQDAEIAARRRTFWNAASPKEQMEVWMDAYRGLPLSHQGWVPAEVTCTQQECRVRWGRINQRATPSGVETLPGVPDTSSQTEHQAFTSIPLASIQKIDWGGGVSKWALPDLASRTTAPKVTLFVSPPNKDLTAGLPGSPPVKIGRAGDWRLTVSNYLFALSVLDNATIPGVEATTIKFSAIQSSIPGTIEINGTYRVEHAN